MDALAGFKAALATGPAHRERTAGFQVHLDPVRGRVVQRHVLPLAGVEVGAQQPVQVAQQVQVEGCGDTQGVVIGQLQQLGRLDQVHPNQQRATLGKRTRLLKQAQGCIGREVADAGARVKHQRRPFDQTRRQHQLCGKIQPHAHHVQRRVLALHTRQRLAQKVHRDVHGDIARQRQRLQQPGGLGAAAGTQLNHGGLPAHGALNRLRQRRPLFMEDGGLGARGVVLVQLGDGAKQVRAQGVVEEFGRNVRTGLQQPGLGFGHQGRGVHLVQLEESRLAHAHPL